MNLKVLPQAFTVCQISDASEVDFSQAFVFFSKTDEELSLVCKTSAVPANAIAREDGWRAFRVSGVLEFSLVGILAEISGLLADQGISIFAVSTYNTDYLLTKAEVFDRAVLALSAAGYAILE
ncbi:MAG: ACT domain-containing protein [Eubacteriales bacterium]|nr:ACT domain-containing protein [Eubacteriales bacterium]